MNVLLACCVCLMSEDSACRVVRLFDDLYRAGATDDSSAMDRGGREDRGREFHVATNGSSDGNGSRRRPWDLATALAHPQAVQPGDTIRLHEGTYRGGFESRLRGQRDAPIVVRSAAGENVVLDLQPADSSQPAQPLVCRGAWTRYQGFEVLCSHPKRRTTQPGSWPTDLHRGSIECRGDHLQFVNLVVHDLGSGFGFRAEGAGGEISGCLIYNNGHGGPDRGHGHGIYAQNKTSIKRITDNLIFQQFGFGVHAYGSAKASLRGLHIEGNVLFENGCLQKPGLHSGGIFVGGSAPLDDVVVDSNVVYTGGLQVGFGADAENAKVVVRRNTLLGVRLMYQRQLTFEHNSVVSGWPVLSMIENTDAPDATLRFDNNAYFNTHPKRYPFLIQRGDTRLQLWMDKWRERRLDTHSTMTAGRPKGAQVLVRPNRFVPGRAHIAVINWDKQADVDVAMDDVLDRGQRFSIVSARNFHGPPVARGVFGGGTVSLPMGVVEPSQPIGMPNYKLPTLAPGFAAFVVLPESD